METKEKLLDLLKQIEQKKKELKQLKKEYETAFDAVAASWREETKAMFPQLETCNIGEYVGVDVAINGEVYNICLLEDRQKISCMFSLDRKDRKYCGTNIKQFQKYVLKKEDAYNCYLKEVCENYMREHHGTLYDYDVNYTIFFSKENYNDAFKFFIEVVKAATKY